ncbi:MAG: hypothetical protein GY811_21250 [Myxococcales bacterium]|nr:hypothetical protein [Myxococcales bacterium]
MKTVFVLIIALTTSYSCRDFDPCDDPEVSCADSASDFSCSDACDKLFLVCGFEGFGDDIGTCRETCLAEPSEGRNLACYRDATCVAISEGECTPDSSGPYQAYSNAGGPYCGLDSRGGQVYCVPGDNCLDASANQCMPPTDGTYQAYSLARGPYCGEDSRGAAVLCAPGDTCTSEFANTCR